MGDAFEKDNDEGWTESIQGWYPQVPASTLVEACCHSVRLDRRSVRSVALALPYQQTLVARKCRHQSQAPTQQSEGDTEDETPLDGRRVSSKFVQESAELAMSA